MDIAVQIAMILTPIVIGIGFYFAWVQWSSMRKARMAQLVMSIFQQWSSAQMINARQAVNLSGSSLKNAFESAEKTNDIKFFSEYSLVVNFFDTLGVLVCEGYLECRVAFDMFGKTEKHYYNLYEDTIKATEFKGYVPYFLKLHELFIQEEACRSSVKKRHAL